MVVGSSGCVNLATGDVADIHITNVTAVDLTVSIRVRRRSDEQSLLDETVVLPGETDERPGESEDSSETYPDVVEDDGVEVDIYVDVAGGPEKRSHRPDLGMDSKGVVVELSGDRITFFASQE